MRILQVREKGRRWRGDCLEGWLAELTTTLRWVGGALSIGKKEVYEELGTSVTSGNYFCH